MLQPVLSKRKKSIYSKYKALEALEYGDGVTIKADSTFTRDKTGAGSIEYFDPGQKSVIYDSYTARHPGPGTHGILYNPKTNTDQDIALDMLHGMRKADKTYADIRSNFANESLRYDGGDFKRDWENNKYRRYKNGYRGKDVEGDGETVYLDNWIDGRIRSTLFNGSDKDFKKANYYRPDGERIRLHKDMGRAWKPLEEYIHTGKTKYYGPGFRKGGILYKK